MPSVIVTPQPVYGLPFGGVRSYRALVLGIPNLLAHLALQERDGTTMADLLGAHDGTISGDYVLADSVGPFGGSHVAPFFGGTNARVILASALADSSIRAVAAWVKSATNQSSKSIWDEASGSAAAALTMRTGPNPIAGGTASHLAGGMTGNDFSVLKGSSGSPLNDGLWHHCMIVVSGSVGVQWSATQTKLYYDGYQVALAVTSTENYVGVSRKAPTASVAATIGSAAAGDYWTGWICEVSCWASAPTPAQAARLAATRTP